MKLIQKWTESDKHTLLKSIIENIDVEFEDIVVFGSRVFGGFKPTSDIDVVVYTKDYKDKKNINFYFEGVSNTESKYNNFRVSIKHREPNENYLQDLWTSVGCDYFLPRYSIITDIFYEGNNNHVLHHQGIRALLKKHKGINVPFDEYKAKNIKLLR
jgi:hypothetical protein